MSIQELYQQTIKPLATAQRLELAAMILGDIPPQSVVDYQTEWSEEDLADLSQAMLSDRHWQGVMASVHGALG